MIQQFPFTRKRIARVQIGTIPHTAIRLWGSYFLVLLPYGGTVDEK